MGNRVKMAMAVLVATAVMVEGWALRERVRAHMATVTWYTVSHSTRERNLSSGVLLTGGDGKIFNKNTREPANDM